MIMKKQFLLLTLSILTVYANNAIADEIITFQDSKVKAICLSLWDANADGNLSVDEAAAVTSVGEAFSGNTEITRFNELRYFSGLTAIDDYAFDFCTSLREIQLPANVTVIGVSAFDGCASLNAITLPSQLEVIGDWAFYNCAKIKRLEVPGSVTSIGDYTFSDCSALSDLTFLYGISSIGEGAFQNCTALTKVTLPATVTSIAWGAFYECKALTDVTVLFSTPLPIQATTFSNRQNASLMVPAGCSGAFAAANFWREFKTIGEMPVQTISFEDEAVRALCVSNWDVDGDGELSYNEAAAVTSIEGVFKDNASIRSFHELQYFTALTALPANAFSNCSQLLAVTLPAGINTLGENAFSGCAALTAIDVVGQNASFTSVDGVLFSKDLATLLRYPGAKGASYAVPEGTVAVGREAFSECAIQEVTFPASLTTIEPYAFAQCEQLEKLELPEGFTTLSEWAFYGCSQLIEVYLPSTLSHIGEGVFSECSSIINVFSQILSPTPIADNTFDIEVYVYGMLHVSMGKVGVYNATEGWNFFAQIMDDLNVVDDEMIASVDDVVAYPNCPAQIVVSLDNGSAVLNGYRFRLALPVGFTLEKDDEVSFLYELSDRYTDKEGMQVTIAQSDEREYLIVCKASGKETLTGAEGPVISLSVIADETVAVDDYTANVSDFVCNYIYDLEFSAEDQSFMISLSDFDTGDVNCDGNVNVADVMLVVNYILGNSSAFFHDDKADFNSDERIDVADAMGIVKLILNSTAEMPQTQITLLNGPTLTGNNGMFQLNMDNAASYTAFQIEVVVPQGASLRDVTLCEDVSAGHSVRFNRLDNGHYKVVVFSLNGKAFRDNAAGLLQFAVDGASADEICIKNIQFTNAAFETVGFGEVQTATDGISDVKTGTTDEPLYNINGQKVAGNQKGVFISHGRKFIRK